MSNPAEECERFAGFGPGLREWLLYVYDEADYPRAALPLMAALVSLVSDPSGRVDLRRLDRQALEAVGCGRKALGYALAEFAAAGFIREEGEGRKRVYFIREDIAHEAVHGRAAVRRDALRVIEGGKGRSGGGC